MKLSYYIQRAKEYGILKTCKHIPGVLKYFLYSIYAKWRRKRILKSILRQSNATVKPVSGFTLISAFTETSSLSKTMRDFALCLRDAGIPYQTYNLSKENRVSASDLENVLTPTKEFNLFKYTHSANMFVDDGILTTTPTCTHSHISFWEFDNGFRGVNYRLFTNNDVLLAFSDFNAELFQREATGKTRVRKIRYPFRFERQELTPAAEIRQKYGIQENDFVVFFNFDYYCYYRKNPGAIIRAFAKAFKDKPDAKLVFKTKNAKSFPNDVADLLAIAQKEGITDRLITINAFIPGKDIYSLTGACDVYISLHRGEGFGLGIAEAMSLGKPVIVTDYSSTTEFCQKDHALPIPYKLISFNHAQNTNTAYYYVKQCADADVEAAAQALHRCYSDRAWAQDLGQKGRTFIEDYFSIENFRKDVEAFFASFQ